MNQHKKHFSDLIPVFFMGCLFVVIHFFALLLVWPFEKAGMQAFQETDNPLNIVYIFVILLTVTIIILLIAKFWKKKIILFIILVALGYTAFYVFVPIFIFILPFSVAVVFSAVLAVMLIIVLYVYPEWYIIDLCGIIIGAGAIAIFGISLGIFLVILLLIGLAIYDAISVYKTKHMVDLADTVMDLKLPVLLVIPKVKHYSLLKETKSLKEKIKDGEEREAFFMGLGDVVMPGILAAASLRFIENGLPIAISVIIGTLVGFSILMTFVIRGKPQAGLPCLCGGAIAGYIISSYLFYGKLIGLILPSF
ncbi:MAG: presenilin family intramembrane aspartyl protease [Candidatus Thermoplasmatota archaeon]|jgi:presenilin-like A22 family membrane protease|nr:presenilin family intramembrane aspartyl protease [Candidatus Thermoplasmatota archaeon]